jgi:hypothetical protein
MKSLIKPNRYVTIALRRNMSTSRKPDENHSHENHSHEKHLRENHSHENHLRENHSHENHLHDADMYEIIKKQLDDVLYMNPEQFDSLLHQMLIQPRHTRTKLVSDIVDIKNKRKEMASFTPMMMGAAGFAIYTISSVPLVMIVASGGGLFYMFNIQHNKILEKYNHIQNDLIKSLTHKY